MENDANPFTWNWGKNVVSFIRIFWFFFLLTVYKPGAVQINEKWVVDLLDFV